MKKLFIMRVLKNSIFSLLFVYLLIFQSACKQNSSVSPQDVYTFYYYPKLNVYYSKPDSHFHYTIDGGSTWQHKPGSAGLADTLDEKVKLNYPSPEIWRDNEGHLNNYNGTLTNYSSSSTADIYKTSPNAKVPNEYKDSEEEDKEEGTPYKEKRGREKRGKAKHNGNALKKVTDDIKKLLKGGK